MCIRDRGRDTPDRRTDRIPIANTRSQQYLPVQLSRVKNIMPPLTPVGSGGIKCMAAMTNTICGLRVGGLSESQVSYSSSVDANL